MLSTIIQRSEIVIVSKCVYIWFLFNKNTYLKLYPISHPIPPSMLVCV